MLFTRREVAAQTFDRCGSQISLGLTATHQTVGGLSQSSKRSTVPKFPDGLSPRASCGRTPSRIPDLRLVSYARSPLLCSASLLRCDFLGKLLVPSTLRFSFLVGKDLFHNSTWPRPLTICPPQLKLLRDIKNSFPITEDKSFL